MALTEIYVDPSIAADSGAGTVGDPYGDLEYAIEQETFDTTNGTRVNIKAGTAEFIAADLATAMADTSVSIAWAPTEVAPLVLQGYTTAADDGGIGDIDGGAGNFSIFGGDALDYITCKDMHLHNTGSAAVISLDNFCSFINCEVDTSTGAGINLDLNGYVTRCYCHDLGTNSPCMTAQSGSFTFNYCTVTGDTAGTTAGMISFGGTNDGPHYVANNIVQIPTAGSARKGIDTLESAVCEHNSIWANAGIGSGIDLGNSQVATSIKNNIIEGFSGAGGIGIDRAGTAVSVRTYGNNAFYNNTTDTNTVTNFILDNIGADESLGSSAFTDAANGDFSPVDTGGVKEGALPAVIGGGFI